MAIAQQPKIVTDGLVFAYDMANDGKSWKGEPTTNLVPNPSNNGRFTTNNSWGTYNTNQYNGNAYFSIGTISSVSGNIVTTAAAHPLRTYDVVRPQTSGGGLSAGTDYIIKKISSTQFSVHSYNSSQNGSQGYIVPGGGYHKVHEALELNQQISINSTSFPTMWWGAPHLPNSGLVKEIVEGAGPQGQNVMRLHVHRTDGVADGMAYGVYVPVTVGDTINVSYWQRTNYPGKSLGYSTYFGGNSGFSGGYTPTDTEWHRVSFQWTASVTYNFYQYWWPDGSSTVPYWTDICDLQVEVNTASGDTPFTLNQRLANNNLESTPSSPTWNQSASSASGDTLTFSSGSYTSKGVYDLYKTYSGLTNNVNYTWSALVKLGTATNLLVTMNNTQNWNTGPSRTFDQSYGLSSSKWTRIKITGTTNYGAFNLHLGSTNNSPSSGTFRDAHYNTIQTGGTVFIKDVRLVRDDTQSALEDLAGQNTITVNSLTYNSDGSFEFNGSSNYLSNSPNIIKNGGGWTVENWFKLDVVNPSSLYNFIGDSSILYNSWYWTVYQSKLALWNRSPGIWKYGSTTIQPNTWYCACIVCNDAGTGYQFYLNGIAEGGDHTSYSWNSTYAPLQIGYIGRGDASNGRYFDGQLPAMNVYNKALSAAEVQQNFNALRGRYGI